MAIRRSMQTALIVGITVAALLTVMVTPVRGQVAENKTFLLDVSTVDAGDADATLEITLTNTSPNQSLGSANVTVPSPLVVGAVDGPGDPMVEISPSDPQTIELRDLGLAPGVPEGESFTFDVIVDVQQCTPGTSDEFQATAKQSNTYLGTGNDFYWENPGLTATILGTCSLVFAEQPGDAQRNDAITSENYETQGVPIEVHILDASDDPMVATHSTATVSLVALNLDVDDDPIEPGGTSSAMADGGVAMFTPGPTLATSAFEYRLRASADFDGDGVVDAATDSTVFDIVDTAVICKASTETDELCTGIAERAGQRVAVSFAPGPTEFLLVVSLNAADVPDLAELGCGGLSDGDVLTGQYFTSDEDEDPLNGDLSYDIPNASRPLNQYEICWAAPYEFPIDGGGTSTLQAVDGLSKPDGRSVDELAVGFIPNCKKNAPTPPCVSGREFVNGTSTARISVKADTRDPWMRH
jgi:hypothetical protein